MSPSRVARLHATLIFYAGIVFGLSFIATPAKFLATDLTMAQLLLVGRATFGVFAWIEAAFAVTLLVMTWKAGRGLALICFIAMLIAVQYLGLRPVLDQRVTAIGAGSSSAPSLLHQFYGVLELLKLALILLAAWRTRMVTPPAA